MPRLIDADDLKDKALRAYGFAAGSNDPFERGKASAFWEVAKWADEMGHIYDDHMRFRVKRLEEMTEEHRRELGL